MMQREMQLHENVSAWADGVFEVKHEENGRHVFGHGVRIDFLLKAKSALVNRGFCQEWFGVECKVLPDKDFKKCNRTFAQCVSYMHSDFDDARPAFVLVYSGSDAWPKKIDYFVSSVFGKLNVGLLVLAENEWRMIFGGQPYFTSRRGAGKNNVTRFQVGSY